MTDSELDFYHLIDQKQRKESRQGAPQPLPEDSVCHVCNNGELQENKMVIQCSRCNISVHKECYGLFTIPEGFHY